MKKVTTAVKNRSRILIKAMIYRLFRHSAPAVPAGAVLCSLLLPGRFHGICLTGINVPAYLDVTVKKT